jgi:hypothetical protein
MAVAVIHRSTVVQLATERVFDPSAVRPQLCARGDHRVVVLRSREAGMGAQRGQVHGPQIDVETEPVQMSRQAVLYVGLSGAPGHARDREQPSSICAMAASSIAAWAADSPASSATVIWSLPLWRLRG